MAAPKTRRSRNDKLIPREEEPPHLRTKVVPKRLSLGALGWNGSNRLAHGSHELVALPYAKKVELIDGLSMDESVSGARDEYDDTARNDSSCAPRRTPSLMQTAREPAKHTAGQMGEHPKECSPVSVAAASTSARDRT